MSEVAIQIADWTIGADNRTNSSEKFLELVDVVDHIIRGIHVGDNTKSWARLIVAQLAHRHGMAPEKFIKERIHAARNYGMKR